MSSSLGGLGNLTQSARTKQLKTARGILFGVGILTVAVNLFFTLSAESEVNKELEKQVSEVQRKGMVVDEHKLAEVRQQAVQSVRLVGGAKIGRASCRERV